MKKKCKGCDVQFERDRNFFGYCESCRIAYGRHMLYEKGSVRPPKGR